MYYVKADGKNFSTFSKINAKKRKIGINFDKLLFPLYICSPFFGLLARAQIIID